MRNIIFIKPAHPATTANRAWALLFLCCTSALNAQYAPVNLPIFVIETGGREIPDEPKITARLGVIDNGPGARNFPADRFNVYDGQVGIELRGASTKYLDQRSYTIELRDEKGADREASLLGLPEEADWALRAPFTDKSLIRDALSYQLSNDIGRWAPHTRFCEVWLNGDYQGVYLLVESIKRSKNRLNLSKLKPGDLAGEDLSGGYIVKVDRWQEAPGWIDNTPPNYPKREQIYFHYVYPKGDDIAPEQAAYIDNYIDTFELVMAAPYSADPALGWRRYADEASFIDHFLLNELARNVDSYRLSAFYFKDKNGKLNAGPLWDFNFAWRNADYCGAQYPEGWTTDVCPWGIPFWWGLMLKEPAFQERLRCRWNELRQTVFTTEHIYGVIDSLAGVVQEAQSRHYRRWPILGRYLWPNPAPLAETHEDEIAHMKKWVALRLAWMDARLPGVCPSESERSAETREWFVAPNPFSDRLFVFTWRFPSNTNLEMYDALGRIVRNIRLDNDLTEIPVGGLGSGLYVLVFRDWTGKVKHRASVWKN